MVVVITGLVLHRRICSHWFVCSWLTNRGRNRAFVASAALSTMESWVWSIHPLFQLIFGCTAANQGYPSIALCSPSSVRKNLIFVEVDPVWIARSV